MTIPEPELPKQSIPGKMAEVADEDEPESHPFLISFAKYNVGLCEIDRLEKNKLKKALDTMKLIGSQVYDVKDFQRKNIDMIPVRGEGDYRRLYSKLSPDIELREIKLQQNARIFYFIHEPRKTMFIVAVTNNHYETDKVRR